MVSHIEEGDRAAHFDVHETYFDAYRNVMSQVYKDPHGKICIYTEMKKATVYHPPYYSSEDQNGVSTLVRNYRRSPVQVTYLWKYIVSK